jgi:hypothetical protein
MDMVKVQVSRQLECYCGDNLFICFIVIVLNQAFILRSYCHLKDGNYNMLRILSNLQGKITDNRTGQPWPNTNSVIIRDTASYFWTIKLRLHS